jgi:hypothetical protein
MRDWNMAVYIIVGVHVVAVLNYRIIVDISFELFLNVIIPFSVIADTTPCNTHFHSRVVIRL